MAGKNRAKNSVFIDKTGETLATASAINAVNDALTSHLEDCASQIQKDSYNQRIEKIVDLVGMNNFAFFLTFQEDDQPYYDLFDREIVFDGMYPKRLPKYRGGPLGNYVSNEGKPSDNLLLQSNQSYCGGNLDPEYSAKYATKISYPEGYIGSVGVNLRRKGVISNSAFKITLYTDDGGKPGSPLEQYDKIYIDGREDPLRSALPETYADIRTQLISGFGLVQNTSYWLVLEYEDDTGIDVDNHVQWRYGSNPGSARAYWDGADWVVVEDESFNYKLFPEKIQLPEDFTFTILLQQNEEDIMIEAPIFVATNNKRSCLRIARDRGLYSVYIFDEKDRAYQSHNYRPGPTLQNWSTLTVTFSKYKTLEKIKIYHNGLLLESGNGVINPTGNRIRRGVTGGGGASLPRIASYGIGRTFTETSAVWGKFWRGKIGPLFLAKRELSEEEVAEVSRIMLGDFTNLGVE